MEAKEWRDKSAWFMEEFNKGNLDPADEVFAKDFIYHRPPAPDIVGVTAWKEMVTDLRNLLPDFKETVDQLIIEGDKAVVRLTFQGTHTGQSKNFPFPPTGKKAVWTGCSVMYVKGDKVFEVWEYPDSLGFLQQLGVIPSM
jgi:steroid delta-isomerase-like uncharacterized protein